MCDETEAVETDLSQSWLMGLVNLHQHDVRSSKNAMNQEMEDLEDNPSVSYSCSSKTQRPWQAGGQHCWPCVKQSGRRSRALLNCLPLTSPVPSAAVLNILLMCLYHFHWITKYNRPCPCAEPLGQTEAWGVHLTGRHPDYLGTQRWAVKTKERGKKTEERGQMWNARWKGWAEGRVRRREAKEGTAGKRGEGKWQGECNLWDGEEKKVKIGNK